MNAKLKISYIIVGVEGVKTEELIIIGRKTYTAEYLVYAHKMLANKLGLDSKEIKIIDWEYLGEVK